MQILIMAAQLILGLSILVTLHELGHFVAARAFGIKVEKFYLFFDAWNFKLFSFKIGETEYGMGWLPLGGYVKIAGMVDESLDTEQLKQAPQPWEFRSKPAWQRLIVMVGGVTVNALLGMFLFAMVLLTFVKGYTSNPDIKPGIYAYELGRKIGLQTGDKIVALNGKAVERYEDLLSAKTVFGADLTINRGGQTMHIQVPDDFYRQVSATGRGHFIGDSNYPVLVDTVLPNTAASKAGMQKGDRVIAANNVHTPVLGSLHEELRKMAGKSGTITILRSADTLQLNTSVDKDGTLGFAAKNETPVKAYTITSAIAYGTGDAIDAIVTNIKGLGNIFKGKEKASDSMQGPIGIAKIYGGTWDWYRFWSITALLSMVLAFMNILPIPALDGGHVVIYSLEAITGKKLSDKALERVQMVGMVILLSLMVFVLGNDVWKHILN